MCSAIFLRITLIGTIWTFSPGLYTGPGSGAPRRSAGLGDAAGLGDVAGPDDVAGLGDAAGAGNLAGVGGAAVGRCAPDSMNPRMSCLVTRPLIPVPFTSLMSTLCSLAMRRT